MPFTLPSPPPPQHLVDADKVVDTSWHQWFTMLWKQLSALYDAIAALPTPAAAGGDMVPYLIPENTVFTVPINKQALFSMTIDVEGILVVNGFLIQVP